MQIDAQATMQIINAQAITQTREWADALPVMASRLVCVAARMVHLSQDGKVGLMRGKRKHDQICIQAIQAVFCVGVPAWAVTLLPDVTHHLVFSFPRHICI